MEYGYRYQWKGGSVSDTNQGGKPQMELSAERDHAKRETERMIVTLLSDMLIRQVVQTIYDARVSFFESFPLHRDGSLRDELTFDETHLAGSGYRLWQSLLEPTVSRYSQKP